MGLAPVSFASCFPNPETQKTNAMFLSPAGSRRPFFEEHGVWQDAPVLTGTTKFEPLPDVKNIMVTGGAGFMYTPHSVEKSSSWCH